MSGAVIVGAWTLGLTALTYEADAAGGHPAKSAPVVLFVVWLAVVVAVRWTWRRARAARAR